MRPGQNNKRMRGRPNNRKGPNPLTRSYKLSGPDVKIRGTAHHIGEKYLQLARDAQTSGDPVMAESYLQHAEHYFRLIAAAQQVPQQGPGVYQGQPGEANVEEAEDDSDFAGMPDKFASPAERFAPPQPSIPPQPSPAPRSPVRSGLSMAMGTDRISAGRTVFRGRSALFKTGITGTGNIKPTRKNRIRSSGLIKNAMGAAAIRRVAATVDGVRAIFAMKARSGSIRAPSPKWPRQSKATSFRRSSLPRFASQPKPMTPHRPSRHFPPCSPVR